MNRSGLFLKCIIECLVLVIFFDGLCDSRGPGGTRLRTRCRRRDRVNRHAAKTVDAREPVIVERRVDDAVVARRMIEAMLVGDDSHVGQPAKENQCAELVLIFLTRLREGRPV